MAFARRLIRELDSFSLAESNKVVMKRLIACLLCSTLISLSINSYGQRRKPSEFFSILDNGRWGFIDKSGKLIIKPQFNGAWSSKEGLATNLNGEKWGYVDASGRMVIPAQFDSPGEFSEGSAAVATTRKYG